MDGVCEAVDRQERFSARPRVPDDPGNGFFILAQSENLDFSSPFLFQLTSFLRDFLHDTLERTYQPAMIDE